MRAIVVNAFRVSWVAAVLWMLLTISGCSDSGDGQSGPAVELPPTVVCVDPIDRSAVTGETADDALSGDLDAIQSRGRLRILAPANPGGMFFLPREGWPSEAQYEAAEHFAAAVGLEAEIVPVGRLADMIPLLVGGEGDLIAANMTITDRRRERIAFSVPLTTVRQQVIVEAGRTDIRGLADLTGKTVVVDRHSSFWERLSELKADFPGIELIERPAHLTDEDELDRVSSGEFDATVRDSNVADRYLDYRDDLKVAFELPGIDRIAWGVRKESPRLRAALNRFLHLEFAGQQQAPSKRADWAGMKERRILRILLRNNAASYFVHRGELHGFEYDLAKAFADKHGLRLEVIVPSSRSEMLAWLKEGRADLAAGFLEASDALVEHGIDFSRPYHYAHRHLVIRADDGRPDSGLAGRTITIARDSPYADDLERLGSLGVGFRINRLAESVETEELIERVADGEFEATIADGHLLDIELARGLPVRSGMQLQEERAHVVAMRAEDRLLKEKIDAFIKRHYRGTFYNVLRDKYFRNHETVRDLASGRFGRGDDRDLSPYDPAIQRYAEQYGFDWRLIVAQMYQESRFDPDARSFAGARGLLQVLPKTARFMGFQELDGPEDGIHAGVKYLDWVRDRFEPTLPFDERLWFTLAAYNAGHGHVQDARRLARSKGWDGDRWFGHTERAMLLLSKKKYARKARYGYVRGSEPVKYVREIRMRYRAYTDMSDGALSHATLPDRLFTAGVDRLVTLHR